MNSKFILALGAAATAALAVISIPAAAGDGWGKGWHGMMWQDDDDGPRNMRRRGGYGPMGMRALENHPVFKSFDTDKNGDVSSAELETGLAGLLTTYDADKNKSLSRAEFDTLFAEITRHFADRPFTMLDADEDGEISAEEIQFPAEMMKRMRKLHGDQGPDNDD